MMNTISDRMKHHVSKEVGRRRVHNILFLSNWFGQKNLKDTLYQFTEFLSQ